MSIGDFFSKYNAVPATDAGPDWSKATTEALDGQLHTMLDACNRDAEDGRRGQAFEGLRQQMAGVAGELIRRTDTGYMPDDLFRIVALCVPEENE